jgi:hypothetical protein
LFSVANSSWVSSNLLGIICSLEVELIIMASYWHTFWRPSIHPSAPLHPAHEPWQERGDLCDLMF